jgi:tetraacyldisaccharide-1-P 4'-kinase
VLSARAVGARAPSALERDVSGRPVLAVQTDLSATLLGTGAPVDLPALATARVGVVLAIARPERFVRSLAAYGIVPAVSRFCADHAVPRPSRRGRAPLDVWLTTPKCATKLGAWFEGAPVVVLRQQLSLPSALLGKFSE